MSVRRVQAGVLGSGDASAEVCAQAEEVGRVLASLGATVITGGLGGVMEAAARGAREAGGLAVGLVPSGEHADANEHCGVVIPTSMGHGRNVLCALAGDFVVAVGGSAGTMSEVCLAWVHARPVVAVACAGGWAEELERSPPDGRGGRLLVVRAMGELEAVLGGLVGELEKSL